jgi:hypothetical protein
MNFRLPLRILRTLVVGVSNKAVKSKEEDFDELPLPYRDDYARPYIQD